MRLSILQYAPSPILIVKAPRKTLSTRAFKRIPRFEAASSCRPGEGQEVGLFGLWGFKKGVRHQGLGFRILGFRVFGAFSF